MRKISRMATAFIVGAALLCGGWLATQPAFAASTPKSCRLVVYTPAKVGGSVKSEGGRVECSTPISTTVAIKGVRAGGVPDSVLAKSSKLAANMTWFVYYGSPTKGSEYRTQVWNANGTKQSGTLKW